MNFFADLSTRAKLALAFGISILIMIIVATGAVKITYDSIQASDRILPSLILLSLKWLWVAICSNLSCCVHGVLDLHLMEQQAFLPDITIIEFQSQHFF